MYLFQFRSSCGIAQSTNGTETDTNINNNKNIYQQQQQIQMTATHPVFIRIECFFKQLDRIWGDPVFQLEANFLWG